MASGTRSELFHRDPTPPDTCQQSLKCCPRSTALVFPSPPGGVWKFCAPPPLSGMAGQLTQSYSGRMSWEVVGAQWRLCQESLSRNNRKKTPVFRKNKSNVLSRKRFYRSGHRACLCGLCCHLLISKYIYIYIMYILFIIHTHVYKILKILDDFY